MAEATTLTAALLNGAALKCPRCGEGKLFYKYLKRVDACPHCGENFVGLDADDGPAWLTIVLSTHIIGPLFMYLEYNELLSPVAEVALCAAVLTALVLAILPSAKGVFIAHMWWLERRPGAQEGKGTS